MATEPAQGDPGMESMILPVISCVCSELAEAGRPVCCCAWYRGDGHPPADNCSCTCEDPQWHDAEGQGIAWARVVSIDNVADPIQPRNSFGNTDCSVPPPRLRVTFDVGIYRCVPVGAPESGPECQEHTQTAADGAWDDLLIRRAVWCCAPLEGRRLTFVRQVPVGPSGGCGGSVATWTADWHASRETAS
ncbi:hypothetical protein ACMATS_06105 [Streptoverticillium reticulum]|uniref:hypothetical protein n=1 Tax=Streptoverticillium reticulum TaxID=1433415 RepID=UPI0039BF942C